MYEKKVPFKFPSLSTLFPALASNDTDQSDEIWDIPLSEIDSFPDHPFHIRDDEDMQNLVESIKAHGVIRVR